MGYRLDIHKVVNTEKIDNIYYGTKLYGYKDKSNFLSYIYLVSIGKMDYEEFFDYGDFYCTFKEYVFTHHDNNDGKLFIDIHCHIIDSKYKN